MLLKHCDHCNKILKEESKKIDIRIGGYVDSADLCMYCLGKLMYMNEEFLNGIEFAREDDNGRWRNI